MMRATVTERCQCGGEVTVTSMRSGVIESTVALFQSEHHNCLVFQSASLDVGTHHESGEADTTIGFITPGLTYNQIERGEPHEQD
jgi:hypothetical protein